jgi:hypothetical protein
MIYEDSCNEKSVKNIPGNVKREKRQQNSEALPENWI